MIVYFGHFFSGKGMEVDVGRGFSCLTKSHKAEVIT